MGRLPVLGISKASLLVRGSPALGSAKLKEAATAVRVHVLQGQQQGLHCCL